MDLAGARALLGCRTTEWNWHAIPARRPACSVLAAEPDPRSSWSRGGPGHTEALPPDGGLGNSTLQLRDGHVTICIGHLTTDQMLEARAFSQADRRTELGFTSSYV